MAEQEYGSQCSEYPADQGKKHQLFFRNSALSVDRSLFILIEQHGRIDPETDVKQPLVDEKQKNCCENDNYMLHRNSSRNYDSSFRATHIRYAL